MDIGVVSPFKKFWSEISDEQVQEQRLFSKLTFSVIRHFLGNPCEIDDYKDLNQGDRTEGYKDATDKCDSEDLKDEWHYWYVVSGNAGNALASKNAPKKGTCGTKDRLYLKDGHPDFHDGEVTKTVCIAQDNTACSSERHIQVINCGAFYLYKLVDLGYCTWRYCTNGEGE